MTIIERAQELLFSIHIFQISRYISCYSTDIKKTKFNNTLVRNSISKKNNFKIGKSFVILFQTGVIKNFYEILRVLSELYLDSCVIILLFSYIFRDRNKNTAIEFFKIILWA